MAHHKSDEYIKCNKLVYSISKHVVCSECNNSLHFKCSRLSKKYYLSKKFSIYLSKCTDYKCIKFEKHVYYGQKGILCSDCDLWIHHQCAGLNNSQYD